MGIGGVTSGNNSMSVMQMTPASLKDHKSKNIQNEITDVQRQIQKLSSKDELSVNEKTDERKKLQREKSSLDTELKQYQEELLRSQKREIRLAELQEQPNPEDEETKDGSQASEAVSDAPEKESRPTDEKQPLQPGTIITQNSDGTVILKEALQQAESDDKAVENTQEKGKPAIAAEASTAVEKDVQAQAEEESEDKESEDTTADTAFSDKQMQAMVSSDTSMKQAERMGTLVTKTEDGIAILKGEIKQDAYRGVDTGRKEAELKDMQNQREQEMGVQFALLGAGGHIMKSAAGSETVKDSNQEDVGKNFQVSGLNAPQDEQAAQERFHVAIA